MSLADRRFIKPRKLTLKLGEDPTVAAFRQSNQEIAATIIVTGLVVGLAGVIVGWILRSIAPPS